MGKLFSACRVAVEWSWSIFEIAGGGLAVILYLWSNYAGEGQVPLVRLAFIALFFSLVVGCFKNYRLQSLLRPKLRFACSPNIRLCKLPDPLDSYCAYRVRVTNIGRETITLCKARLTGIYRGSEVLCEGDSPLLNFAQDHEGDATSKSLSCGHPYPLDILFVFKDGKIKMGTGDNWPFKSPWRIFTDSGDYTIKVSVAGEPLQSVKLELRFKWTCDYATSELWLDKIEPEEARDINP